MSSLENTKQLLAERVKKQSPTEKQAESKDNPPHAFKLCLETNKEWSSKVSSTHPELFPTLSKGQSPPILWIGCSDSRVPETTILGALPGDIFVHRNIANVVHAGDISAAAVITYAVVHLKVQHVVLCGHTLCGGVNAALGNSRLGLLDTWLLPVRSSRRKLIEEEEGWNSWSDEEKALKLVEANVRRGVGVLKENADVIEAVKERGLKVHGAVYDVTTGVLRELEDDESEDAAEKRVTVFGMK
jgi:carbonic anhydrase